MTKSKIAGVLGLLGALVVSGYGHEVIAQAANSVLSMGGSTSNYGQRTLAPGFVPDPVNIQVTSGGNIDVSSVNFGGTHCVGHVTRQPDFILHMSGNSPTLRVYVTVPNAHAVSATDTTLIVNDAHGGWHCNDDSWGGVNPTVDLPNTGAGQYDIWIGSYTTQRATGTLHITELASNHP